MPIIDYAHDEIEHLVFADVDLKVMKKMGEMLAAIPNNRMLDLELFYDYCLEYFELPECTIERCIHQLKFSKLSDEEFNLLMHNLKYPINYHKEVL